MARWGARTTAEEATVEVDLTGKVAVVTGANSGIGAETARVLALRGAHVVMACRNLARADEARRRIVGESRGRVPESRLELMRLDLANLGSVRTFAHEWTEQKRALHLLIHNAGVLHPQRRETQEGFEAHFGVNYLGPFLLTTLLLDVLVGSAPARVIAVACDPSQSARLDARLADLSWTARKFHMGQAYADSKLMNLMFVRELDRRLRDTGVVAHAVNPGAVATALTREAALGSGLFAGLLPSKLKSVAQAAATTLVAATSPSYAFQGGVYFADCQPHTEHRLARDPGACRRLWDLSAELVSKRDDDAWQATANAGSRGPRAAS